MSKIPSASQAYYRAYLDALLAGDSRLADSVITNGFEAGLTAPELFLQVLTPAQTEIGLQWHAGLISVSDEHLATHITLRQCERIRELFPPNQVHGHRVVVASNDGDMHWLGARIVSDFFYFDGWEVFFVGQNLPPEDLLKYIEKQKAEVFALSVTLEPDLDRLQPFLQKVKQLVNSPHIILGGAALSAASTARAALNEYIVAPDALSAIDLANGFFGGQESEVLLEHVLHQLGERIHRLRKARRFSQQFLADRAGVDRAYLCSLEGGKKNVSVGVLLKLATALEIKLNELL